MPVAGGPAHLALSLPYPNWGVRWSPDGRWLAVVAHTSGQDHGTFIVPAEGGGAQAIVDITGPICAKDPCWSPDSTRIAFASNVRGFYNIGIYELATGRITWVTEGEGAKEYPVWSPDGQRLAYIITHGPTTALAVLQLGKGSPTIYQVEPGVHYRPRFTPDGKHLVFLFDNPRHPPNLWLLSLRPCPRPEASAEASAEAPSRRRRSAEAGHRSEGSELALNEVKGQALANGHLEQLTHSLRPFSELALNEVKGQALPADPSGLRGEPPSGRAPRGEGSGERASPSEPALSGAKGRSLEDAPFAMPTQVRYPSLDGRSVPALLYRPRRSEGLPPAVVYVHGGPNWLTQVTWDPLVQHMVSRGWVVLAPNYRGSTGYGRAWQLANRFDLGGGDTQDVVAAADYLIREGLADPDRIAVTGTSYGGYLTMICLTQYPDRWAAGSAVVSFLNWFTGWADERQDLIHWDRENFGDPHEDRDLFYERSPYFFLDRIIAPVQLICGAHDPRCPASESIQARDALVALGKPCDFALYPDEGHTFLKIENVVDSKKRRVAFLAQVLEGK